MPVFSEETLPLPIFNGLGITDRPTDSLCPQLVNMILSAENEYRIREDFMILQARNFVANAIPTTLGIPRNLHASTLEIFQAIGSPSVDSPSIMAFYDNGTTREVHWLNTNNTLPLTANITQTIPAGYGVKAFCQYRDRYYASNGVSKIYRIFNFVTTPATPVTVTDLIAPPNGVDLLLTFRSRVFGIKKNKIYYTDLPTIGGYPEVWNLSTNVIDIPSIDYDVTVHNAIVYRDKIYLFTDKGIYVFNVVGAPANWSIQLVSSNFPIYDRDSVAINKNLVFLTDQQSVTSFDGSSFKLVSGNIRSVFHNAPSTYTWFSLYPWEEGIVLARNGYNASGGNYIPVVPNSSGRRLLYFNTVMWTEISWFLNKVNFIKGGRNLMPLRSKIASSWIYCYNNTADGNTSCEFLDNGFWKGDAPLDYVGGTRQAKPITLETPSPFIKDRKYHKYKYCDVYGYLKVNVAASSLTMNGEAVVAGDQGRSIFKAPIDSVLGSQFEGIPTAPMLMIGQIKDNPDGGNVPPLLLIGIDLVYNQDNKGRDGMGSQ